MLPAAATASTDPARITMKPMTCVLILLAAAVSAPARGEVDWARLAGPDVVEIVTSDEDGDPRQTSVWIVALDGNGYVRTNDSRWLANIRRGSGIALRSDGLDVSLAAREVSDPE